MGRRGAHGISLVSGAALGAQDLAVSSREGLQERTVDTQRSVANVRTGKDGNLQEDTALSHLTWGRDLPCQGGTIQVPGPLSLVAVGLGAGNSVPGEGTAWSETQASEQKVTTLMPTCER